MTREEYLQSLYKTYRPVTVLSEKNEGRTVRLRHRELEKDLVLHSFPHLFEAYEALCHVKCDHLPEVYDAISLDDGQIVLEEYIDGITVSQAMEGMNSRPFDAKKVLSGVCDALTVLHGRGIIHRDVKPENVMIEKSGRVVLIDLNASRILKNAKKDTQILGTVGYASPEQLGLSQTDARTDIYAAGVLYNVMLTGQHPSLSIAGGKAGRIVRKCTAVNPADRYQTAQELWKAL